MKTLGFRFDPSVRMLLDEEDIVVLILCGASHPKFSCQIAVQPGGFVHEWRQRWLDSAVGSVGIEVEVSGVMLEIVEMLLVRSVSLFGVDSPRGKRAVEMLHLVRALTLELTQHFVRLNPEMVKGA